jgi:hypothetical protein
MTDMPNPPAHARPKDHLWVLVIIAACCLLEVWVSWVTIGSMSGFPRVLGRIPTDWVLAVTSEAYWGYALYAWLAASPGPKSRRFAMWSAAGVFAGSLVGQGASHLVSRGTVAPPALVVFVTDLPVLVLALIAILIHLRHLDRADAEKAAERARMAVAEAHRDAAEASELAAVRAELDAERAALEPLRAELGIARAELARVTAMAEALKRKLAAATGRKQPRKPAGATGRKPAGTTARKSGPATAPETDSDVDSEALVLKYLAEGHSASEAGKLAGLSDSRGRQIARKLATAAPRGQDPEE